MTGHYEDKAGHQMVDDDAHLEAVGADHSLKSQLSKNTAPSQGVWLMVALLPFFLFAGANFIAGRSVSDLKVSQASMFRVADCVCKSVRLWADKMEDDPHLFGLKHFCTYVLTGIVGC